VVLFSHLTPEPALRWSVENRATWQCVVAAVFNRQANQTMRAVLQLSLKLMNLGMAVENRRHVPAAKTLQVPREGKRRALLPIL